jgi:hypothetical protein
MLNSLNPMKNNFRKVWGMPLIIGICSAVGLLSALTGDGIYDTLSWLTLGFAVVVAFWFLVNSKSGNDKDIVKIQ